MTADISTGRALDPGADPNAPRGLAPVSPLPVRPVHPGGYRLQPDYFEPVRVPAEVLRYAGGDSPLPVGSPGKVGILQLGFEHNQDRDRTELVQHYQKSPLQIMRPLYFDPLRPDVPYTYVMSSGGGILQADRLRTDLTFGTGTSAHVTTQAQTRVYRMDYDYASSVTNISVGAGAYTEYLPEPVVPFAGSRFYQHTSVTLDESATLLLGETVYAGRLARDERHRYEVYASDVEVRRPGGRLVALDRVRLCPGEDHDSAAAPSLGVLADHDILAMLYVFTPLVPVAALADLLHDALAATLPDGLFGVSALPNDAGVWMRLVANDPVTVARATHAAAGAAHEALTGFAAPAIRKM